MGILQSIDTHILLTLHTSLQNRFFDIAMPIITSLGNYGMIWIIISSLMVISKRYRIVGLLAFTALIFGTILGEGIIKPLIERNRPFVNILSLKLLIPSPISYSFPSGHSLVAFAVSGVILKYLKKLGVILIILASLIAFSRLYLLVHYPSDVLAGIIIGLLCSKIVILTEPQLTHMLGKS
jgi:undecaprenyl-diphosphatase